MKKPPATTTPVRSGGRKDAYVARNRASLIRAAQRAFAEIGPDASVESIAAYAEVSPSTIYKHFETKDNLLTAAFAEAMTDWESWAQDKMLGVEDPLERLVIPMRLLLRIRESHPHYAEMIAKNFRDIPRFVPIISVGVVTRVRILVQEKVLSIDHFDIRMQSFSACMLTAIGAQLHNATKSYEDADTAVEIALGLLGLTPAKAKKLAHGQLPALA